MIGLQNTGEASMVRKINQVGTEWRSVSLNSRAQTQTHTRKPMYQYICIAAQGGSSGNLEFLSSARESLIALIEDHFPVVVQPSKSKGAGGGGGVEMDAEDGGVLSSQATPLKDDGGVLIRPVIYHLHE